MLRYSMRSRLLGHPCVPLCEIGRPLLVLDAEKENVFVFVPRMRRRNRLHSKVAEAMNPFPLLNPPPVARPGANVCRLSSATEVEIDHEGQRAFHALLSRFRDVASHGEHVRLHFSRRPRLLGATDVDLSRDMLAE